MRAAPPPAPTRDAIKTGKFDAVVFTSSSTVRNLVGIAGKPHPSTVIAVIGPATAKTAEEHGLRVDVLAPEPDVELLVDALADFGAAPPAGDARGRRAGDQAVASASRSARREAAGATAMTADAALARRDRTGGPAAPAAAARPALRRMVAETVAASRGSWCCRCSCARGSTSRGRSRRCPASSSTPATRCCKAVAEAAELGLGGVMLFGIPDDEGRHRLRRASTPTASSTSRSPTWSPRSATRSP